MEWADRNAPGDSVAFGRCRICTRQPEAAEAESGSMKVIPKPICLSEMTQQALIFATLTSVGFLSVHLNVIKKPKNTGAPI